MEKCPTCKGTGIKPHACEPCLTTGQIITHDEDGNEIIVDCPTCGGTGIDDTCPACGGTGVI
jgi:DnaJ-class molecular chaperone